MAAATAQKQEPRPDAQAESQPDERGRKGTRLRTLQWRDGINVRVLPGRGATPQRDNLDGTKARDAGVTAYLIGELVVVKNAHVLGGKEGQPKRDIIAHVSSFDFVEAW